MRRILSLTLLVAALAVVNTSAQVNDPTNPRVHEVLGVVTKVSASSITVRARDAERELILDRPTLVIGRNRSRLENEWGFRRRPHGEYVQVGDQALVTYRDDRTALRITIATENRLTTP